MATHKVTLADGFPYEGRIRSGIRVTKSVPYEGELTADQLEAIKADGLLTVKQVEEKAAPKPASKPAPRPTRK